MKKDSVLTRMKGEPHKLAMKLKTKNNYNFSSIIKHFNMSLWQVKKHKWQAKVCLACQKIKSMASYIFFLFRALLVPLCVPNCQP